MRPLDAGDPRQVGPYTVLGRLGAGGMGAVYLGRSAGGRTVAVKVVRPELAEDEEFRDRFRREVAAARRVSAAFTAPVVDADPEAAVPWMATAFVAGVSLHQAVTAHGPLPQAALRTLTAGLAEALAGVHESELVHRDFKPGNVLLALDGPRVIDFGISRAVDGTVLTSTGAIIGSAPYMSPEQAMGQPLTAASDIFSLGATLAFAASGRDLFGDGAAAAVLFRVVHTDPDLSSVPEPLRPLLAACLAKDPAQRPTARQVSEAVERLGYPVPSGEWLPPAVAEDVVRARAQLTGPPTTEPSTATPPAEGTDTTELLHHPTLRQALPRKAPTGRGTRRRTLVFGVAGGALAVAGAGTVFALTRRDPPHVSRPSAEDVPGASLLWQRKLPASCAQALPVGDVVVCLSYQRIWALDGKGRTRWTVTAEELDVAFTGPRAKPQTVATVHDGQLLVAGMSLRGLNLTSTVLALDPANGERRWDATSGEPHARSALRLCGVRNGRLYLTGLGDGQDRGYTVDGYHVWALDLATRKAAWFHGGGRAPLFVGLPPRGEHLAFADSGVVTVLNAAGKVAWRRKEETVTLGGAGRHVLVVDRNGRLAALEQRRNKEVWSRSDAVVTPLHDSLVTNEKGDVLYVHLRDVDHGLSLAALDSDTGRQRWRAPLPAGGDDDSRDLGARLLHDGDNLYRLGADATVWAFDPTNGRPRWRYTGPRDADPSNLAWAAGDGKVCVADPSGSWVATLPANGA